MMLLQNAAFVPLFREAVTRRGGELADIKLDALDPWCQRQVMAAWKTFSST